MFELLSIAIFIWLLVKSIGLAFPVLIVCFVFIGGIALLVPVVMIAIAAGILKACF